MPIVASWYHCSVKSISRSTGRTAIAAAAYRSGERLHDKQTDQTHDYTRKRGVEASFIVTPENAPEWASNLESLWNEAQAKDNRKNSCLAREVELALPSDIDVAGRAALVRDFSLHLVERYGVAVSAAVHEPGKYGDENNYHAHILFTTRRMDENGLGAKTRELDALATRGQEVKHIREYAASLINSYLEDAGSEERIDHRSYDDRGINREPTTHLGTAAAALERRGVETDRGDINRTIAEINHHIDQLAGEVTEINRTIREIEQEPDQPSAFTDKWTRAYMAQEPPEQPVMYLNDSEVHNPSNVLQEPEPEVDPVLASHKRDILEHGQVQETGLGRQWYDRTITMFENMYYSMIEQAQDLWQRYVRDRDPEPERDRDEPEMEM